LGEWLTSLVPDAHLSGARVPPRPGPPRRRRLSLRHRK
ncbi:MAG: hypothetical protein QOF75_1644, partial [Gaiellaceae bacterium]|nr:hypothetical protein [Gaiellaceae bacterium]